MTYFRLLFVFACLQYKMLSNKKQILSLLRTQQPQLQLALPHLLVILNHNSNTLQQVRKYIKDHIPVPVAHWTELEDSTILKAASESAQYIRMNRQMWSQRESKYLSQLQRSEQIRDKVLSILDVQNHPADAELLTIIEQKKAEREELLKTHLNTESQSSVLEENELISQLTTLLRATMTYEQEQKGLSQEQDQHYQQIIDQFIIQQEYLYTMDAQREKQQERKKVIAKIEEHQRKVIVLKKRLYQIFLFYCRENKSVGLTFEDYGRTSQLIDLRLFLKYFKDYQYNSINKYRFKVTTATQLFRNAATNGLTLSFYQFWEVHRQLFELKDPGITRRDIIQAQKAELPVMASKWEQQIQKLKELNQIVNEERTKELIKVNTIKTESSPQKVTIKQFPGMVDSQVTSNLSSRFPRKKAFSELEGQLLQNKNFIQQVRAQINNAEEPYSRGKISRYNSLSSLESQKKTHTLEVSLPKILKLSSKEITNQGIEKSLKRFSHEDYRNQEKKLRDIIGLSNGDDDRLINAYLHREKEVKEEKKRERSLDREQKRRQFLQGLAKKQHHCKRYNPQEVEPYMRF